MDQIYSPTTTNNKQQVAAIETVPIVQMMRIELCNNFCCTFALMQQTHSNHQVINSMDKLQLLNFISYRKEVGREKQITLIEPNGVETVMNFVKYLSILMCSC